MHLLMTCCPISDTFPQDVPLPLNPHILLPMFHSLGTSVDVLRGVSPAITRAGVGPQAGGWLCARPG